MKKEGNNIIEVSVLTKRFGSVIAVNQIALTYLFFHLRNQNPVEHNALLFGNSTLANSSKPSELENTVI